MQGMGVRVDLFDNAIGKISKVKDHQKLAHNDYLHGGLLEATECPGEQVEAAGGRYGRA